MTDAAPPSIKPCVLCGTPTEYYPFPGGPHKLSMRLTHGHPDVYIVCDDCFGQDSEELAYRIADLPWERRRESLVE